MALFQKNSLIRTIYLYLFALTDLALKDIDYLRARREREASNSLAFIVVGLPLYFYHWTVIKRDKKRDES